MSTQYPECNWFISLVIVCSHLPVGLAMSEGVLSSARRAFFVEHWRGADAISWLGAQEDVAHHSATCLQPPPFAAQCTVHATEALHTCLQLRSCRSFTCPDPTPYRSSPNKPRRRDQIAAPICQARSTISIAEWRRGPRLAANHGMCRPSGCDNFFLTPARLARTELSVSWHPMLLPGKSQSQIVLIPDSVPEGIWRGLLRCVLHVHLLDHRLLPYCLLCFP